jgi:hypothetical protein
MRHKRARTAETPDPLLSTIAVQLHGVMGELQERRDAVLISGDYERDRAACQAAIRQACADLDEAGESGRKEDRAFDLAWAWRHLDEAYARLAHLESRHRLAVRREALHRQPRAVGEH